MEALVAAARGTPHTDVSLAADRRRSEVPLVQLKLDEETAGMSALDLVKRLQNGEPSIHANPGRVSEGIVLFGPMCLKEGDPERIGRRLKELLR
jgi:L-seryl-tRNA(Ser) seleniumtransferase